MYTSCLLCYILLLPVKSNQIRIFNAAKNNNCHYKVHGSAVNMNSYSKMSGNDCWKR